MSVTDSDIPLEVIKIEYKNGAYELINWNGQSEYRVDRGFKWYAGFYVFDENEFQRLIEVLLSQ